MKLITRLLRTLKNRFMTFLMNTKAVSFDLMGIIFMAVAIALGNIFGSMIAGMIGMTGGLIGAFIIGLVIYAVFCLLTGTSMNIMKGAIFAILVYVSGIINGYIGSATGFTGGIIGLILEALILSTLWGYFGKGQSPLGASSTGKRKKGRRKRR